MTTGHTTPCNPAFIKKLTLPIVYSWRALPFEEEHKARYDPKSTQPHQQSIRQTLFGFLTGNLSVQYLSKYF